MEQQHYSWDSTDQHWMAYALALAERAAAEREVPVGAVLVHDGAKIGEGWNQPLLLSDPTAHAEIIALRAAAHKLGNYRLLDSTLYVSLEPCSMCAGAIIHARVKRVVFAAWTQNSSAEDVCNHRVLQQGGLMQEASRVLLQTFFRARR